LFAASSSMALILSSADNDIYVLVRWFFLLELVL
jgi:hypothetical protein